MNIPLEIIQPVLTSRWAFDDYALNRFQINLDGHRDRDIASGCTCAYSHRAGADSHMGSITGDEFHAMAKHIPPVFVKGDWLNQHYEHSIEQFYAEVQRAWDAHTSRTDALIGTPAGTIK